MQSKRETEREMWTVEGDGPVGDAKLINGMSRGDAPAVSLWNAKSLLHQIQTTSTLRGG